MKTNYRTLVIFGILTSFLLGCGDKTASTGGSAADLSLGLSSGVSLSIKNGQGATLGHEHDLDVRVLKIEFRNSAGSWQGVSGRDKHGFFKIPDTADVSGLRVIFDDAKTHIKDPYGHSCALSSKVSLLQLNQPLGSGLSHAKLQVVIDLAKSSFKYPAAGGCIVHHMRIGIRRTSTA